jgi:hypothetical protein
MVAGGGRLATAAATAVAVLVVAAAVVAVAAVLPAGRAAVAAAAPPSTTPVTSPAPGITPSLQAALVREGAYGSHPLRLLMVGDSIALTLGIGLAVDVNAAYGLTIYNHAALGCDLDPTLEIRTSGQIGPATPGCSKWRALWPFLVATVHPQVVALGVGRWEISDHLYQGHWVHIGEASWDTHLLDDLHHAIGIFHEFGARVVLINMPFVDPSNRQPDGQPWVENTESRVREYNALVQQVADDDPDEVSVVNLNKMLSPHGVYTTTVGGVVVRWADGIHVTVAGGEYLQRQILPVIDRLALQVEAADQRR